MIKLQILFLCFSTIQLFCQSQNLEFRLSSGIGFGEPDIRGREIIQNSRFGDGVKQSVSRGKGSLLESYFIALEFNYLIKKRVELNAQLGHTMFYDKFPMVLDQEHFARKGESVFQPLLLNYEYYNYNLSPAIGINVIILNFSNIELQVGSQVQYNTTFFKLARAKHAPRDNFAYRLAKPFFDTHSIEAYTHLGIGYKMYRFYLDYRYYLVEYLDDAMYNDGIPIKYENLTKFRFRISHDLEWEKK